MASRAPSPPRLSRLQLQWPGSRPSWGLWFLGVPGWSEAGGSCATVFTFLCP